MKRLRAVVVVAVLVLAAGVLGGSVAAGYPRPDRQDAFKVSWRDGAKILRVQKVGTHFALVTIAEGRIVAGRRVTESALSGEDLGQWNVYLVADELGLLQASEGLPSDAWWNAVLGIVKHPVAREPMPEPLIPNAESRGPRSDRSGRPPR